MADAFIPETEATVTCAECGRLFSAADTIELAGRRICATCKPVFLQRLREGAAATTSLSYAGFWVRVGAAFLDGLLLIVVNMFVGIVLPLALAANASVTAAVPVVFVLTWLFQMAIAITYETWFVGRHGATPGKMALKLRIVRPDGSPLTYARAFGRHWGKFLSSITLLIGYIIAAFDSEKRALHDRICDTRVVRVG